MASLGVAFYSPHPVRDVEALSFQENPQAASPDWDLTCNWQAVQSAINCPKQFGGNMRDLHLPGRSTVFAANGMCATSHPLGASVALDILKQGGNAMDAAIAGAILLGFCEPQMTGIGGDCFALFTRPGSDGVFAMNGSGRAPQAAEAEQLRGQGLRAVPPNSVQAVTVPGAIDAFCRLSDTVGKLGLEAILAPSIDYAERGIPVAERVAFDWARDASVLSESGARHYLNEGQVPKLGDLFRAPGQAEVLRRVAAEGRDGFYSGPVAEDMVESLKQAGGVHTLEDFAKVEALETEPVSGTYGGVDLIELPPNGQGATAILMLNILKHFDMSGMDPAGATRIHMEAEAAKLAYDARNRFLADPDHTARLEYMLAPETAEKLAALIDPARAMQAAAPLTESIHKETIYITVVDRDRMAVSLIYSIFHGFGSGIASDKYGILFQNRGAGFTLEEGHPNELGGGKRPMHTIIPAMLREGGRITVPFGVMGGGYQPAGHSRFLSNLTDFGMSLQSAIDAPRSFPDGGVLKAERGVPADVCEELAGYGHQIQIPDVPLGGAQAIRIRDDGVLEGASDPRKDGCALGY